MQNKIIVWLFCKVIDNFGDAGTCLRLANLLIQESNFEVIIWIDNLNILHKLQNNINPQLKYQSFKQISFFNLQYFDDIYNFAKIPNCIIEILGVNIPDKAIQIIDENKILWINLEYLSAEKFAKKCHLMQSLQANNIKKYFYFQGFSKNTGGLIREKNYTLLQNNFYQNKAIKYNFLKQNNIYYNNSKIKILIFAYNNTIWEKTIKTLLFINKQIIIWFANHDLLDNLSNYLINYNDKNDTYTYNNLVFQKIKFVEQKYFDYYLWLCDIAIVRGEDSFIRSQFTSKIFLWNIYPQENKDHIIKLIAFLNILKKHLPNSLFKSIYQLSMEINDGNYKLNLTDRLENWQNIIYNINKSNFENWNSFLINQQTTIEKLTHFIKNKLKY